MPKSFHAGHIREPAQITDDDTELVQSKDDVAKQPLGEVRHPRLNMQNIPHIVPQNTQLLKPILKNRSAASLVENVNVFSPTSVKAPIPTPPPIPVRSPLRVTQSKTSLRSVNTFRTASAPGSAAKVSSLSGKNLLHKKNLSTTTLKSTQSVDTPAKLVKKNRRSPHSFTQSTPGSGYPAAVEKQDGSKSTRPRTPGSTWNPSHPSDVEKDDVYGTDGAGLMGPATVTSASSIQLDAQQLGSKRMVDLFLSSRRRRVAGSEDSGAIFL